jgi:3'(2'), 5'-bisphosphate nucleotidase
VRDLDLAGLEPILDLSIRAGEAIMQVYGGDAGVEWKEDRSPLTAADLASHRLIMDGLHRLTPDIPVISEEGADLTAEGRSTAEAFWIVDPLDGTKEFLKRTGEFTVNIALVRGGRLEAGVVHAPALRRSWYGARDGARLTDEDGTVHELRVRPAVPEKLAVVASRDHAGPAVKAFLERVPGASTLSMGSSLKFCLVAEGAADLYFRDGPTMEWDTAAAQCVLESAGGAVYTLDGEPLGYGKGDLRNPMFVAVGDLSLDWRSLIGEWERDSGRHA